MIPQISFYVKRIKILLLTFYKNMREGEYLEITGSEKSVGFSFYCIRFKKIWQS